MNIEALKILMEGASPDGTCCTTAAVEYGHGNAIENETGMFLYGLVRRYQPMNILETGTHWGFSSAWMALALKDICALYPDKEPGRLITLDMNGYDGRPEKLWGRLGLNNILHGIASSEDAKTYHAIKPNECIGMALYDADHSAEAIIREFEASVHLLNRQRCLIAYHDTDLDKRMHAGIVEIIRRLIHMREDGTGWSFISHVPMRNMRGIDLIFLSQDFSYENKT